MHCKQLFQRLLFSNLIVPDTTVPQRIGEARIWRESPGSIRIEVDLGPALYRLRLEPSEPFFGMYANYLGNEDPLQAQSEGPGPLCFYLLGNLLASPKHRLIAWRIAGPYLLAILQTAPDSCSLPEESSSLGSEVERILEIQRLRELASLQVSLRILETISTEH